MIKEINCRRRKWKTRSEDTAELCSVTNSKTNSSPLLGAVLVNQLSKKKKSCLLVTVLQIFIAFTVRTSGYMLYGFYSLLLSFGDWETPQKGKCYQE